MLPKIPKVPRPPFYGNSAMKVAFEFGLILSETAKNRGVELTPEMVVKAEKTLLNEIKLFGVQKTAVNFVPLVMTVFEV
jgi:hypothetical protein